MKSINIPSSALAKAVALAIGISATPQSAIADITLTFENNAIPSTPPLPFLAGTSAGFQFEANTEFRVVTLYGSGTNNGHKDAFFGGETWTFNNTRQLTGTTNTDPNPGGGGEAAVLTAGVTGFPVCSPASSCPTLQRGASFLQPGNFFNFMAPQVGSVPGNTYGISMVTIDLSGKTVNVNLPVAHAQWATGAYIIGGDPNPNPTHGDKCQPNGPCGGPGVNISGPVTVTSGAGAATITFDYRLHGEGKMTKDEVTVLGFNNQTVQWEVPGVGSIDNQNPVAVDDGSVGNPQPANPNTPRNINVLANDFDPDWTLLNSQAFDTLTVAAVGTCSNGGTLTNNTTNVTYLGANIGADSCTYTAADGRTGTSNSATIYLNVSTSSNNPPVASPDGPGGLFATNQGVPVSFDVLENDDAIDAGDTLVVDRVDATSTNGGKVSIVNAGMEGGDNVKFTPASGFSGIDTFTYDCRDKDGTDTATVTVTIAPFAEASVGIVTVSTRLTSADIGVEDPETETSCDGGCFGIEVQGVPSGSQTEVILPNLAAGYIEGSEFRHFVRSTGAWQAHKAPDTVWTAPTDTVTGLCPGIDSATWRAPTMDDTCVKYSITDENGTGVGPNDDDVTPGTIVDPVGFGQATPDVVAQRDLIGKSGCSLNRNASGSWRDAGHWLLISGLLVFLGRLRRRRTG